MRFEPAAGLDVTVATRFVRPVVSRALDMLLDEAQTRAPSVRVWITMRDERVRTTHVEADGQAIPDNLRFRVQKPGEPGVYELARAPRDPALTIGNRANCRCDDPTIPALLRDSLHRSDLDQQGTRVSGFVYTDFPRAAESEFGTDEDTPAHFMTNALREVATRLRSGHAR